MATTVMRLASKKVLRIENPLYMVAQALLPVLACASPLAHSSCLHSQEWLCHSHCGEERGGRYSLEVCF
jgi:hypothetical protein